MNPSSLVREELLYELKIRAIPHHPDLLNTSHLAQLLHREAGTPVKDAAIEALSTEDELHALLPKVAELETLSRELSFHGADTAWHRVVSLYLHTALRLRRFMFRATDPRFPEFLKLARRLIPVLENVQRHYPDLAFPVIHVEEEDLDSRMKKLNLGHQHSGSPSLSSSSGDESRSRRSQGKKKRRKETKKKKKRKQNHSSTDSQSSTASTSTSSDDDHPRRGRRHGAGYRNPVTQWDYKFSGTEDLDNFLEDVECMAETTGVSNGQLLRGVGSLPTGAARTWYRAEKKKLTGWGMFKRKLKSAFQPGDRDDTIMEKLQSLKQKHDETYAVYEARADELFRRMERKISEKEKLRYLLAGLHLFYRQRIVSADMERVRDLRRSCQSLERDKAQIVKLEREEDRRKERYSQSKGGYRVAGAEVSEASEVAVAPEVAATNVADKRSADLRQCWRCGEGGHLPFSCPNVMFCSTCGLPGTTAEKCGHCAEARRRGLWGAAQQTQGQAQQVSTMVPPQFSMAMPGNYMGPWFAGQPGPVMMMPSPYCFPPPQLVPTTNQEPTRGTTASQNQARGEPQSQPRARLASRPPTTGSNPRPTGGK